MPGHPAQDAFAAMLALVEKSGLPHAVHAHRPTRTMREAADNLDFDPARIVKTVAFRTRADGLVLAALPGPLRVDYAKLARLAGLNRRDLFPLSPEEVPERLGVEPGSVSPLPLWPGALLCLDETVLAITPSLYCGLGRPDRTLELAPADLLALVGQGGGRLGNFSR